MTSNAVRMSDPVPVSATPSPARATFRLDALDAWRGLVIVLMVLDHVRDFFHFGAVGYSATDPGQTTAVLYATRWITHLCAPTFIFLAGISIRLQREKIGAAAGLAGFLLKRGLWLLALEFTVISFGFNFGRPFFFIQVIYTIGISMALMSLLVRLPSRAVFCLGALFIAAAPLLIAPLADATGALGVLRTLAILPGPLPGVPGLVLYPFLPWLGVMCLGYGYGHVFRRPAAERNRLVAATAIVLLLGFAVLRGLNGYGDLAPWKIWPAPLQTLESFLNVSKYPASPDYVLATLGVSLLLFLALDRAGGAVVRLLLPFGRTPMFTYIVHIYITHGAQLAIGLLLGYPLAAFTGFISGVVGVMSGHDAEILRVHWGFPLWGVYLVWLLSLALLYPLARWYEGVKRRRQDWWLRYL